MPYLAPLHSPEGTAKKLAELLKRNLDQKTLHRTTPQNRALYGKPKAAEVPKLSAMKGQVFQSFRTPSSILNETGGSLMGGNTSSHKAAQDSSDVDPLEDIYLLPERMKVFTQDLNVERICEYGTLWRNAYMKHPEQLKACIKRLPPVGCELSPKQLSNI